MESGQQYLQVFNSVDDIKQLYPNINVDNVQFVINNGEDVQYGNQLVQMPNQQQEQTFVLHQQEVPQVQHGQPQVVFQSQPAVVSEENVQDQPVFYELQTPQEQALSQQQAAAINQQIQVQQQPVQIINQSPQPIQQISYSQSPTIISQPGQSQQYYVTTPPQQQQQQPQYFIQPIQPGQMQTRIVTYEQAPQVQHQIQRIVVQQQPPPPPQQRIIQQPVRQIIQQQSQPQQTVRMVRMSQPGQVTITSTPRTMAPRPLRTPRPRLPRAAPTTPRLRMTPPQVQTTSQGLQTTPRTYQVQPRPMTPAIVQRTVQPTQNRIVIAPPTRVQSPSGSQQIQQQRVVLRPGNQYLVVPQSAPQTPVAAAPVAVKKSVSSQKSSDDPDDIESSIPGVVVSRKSDPEEEQVRLQNGEIISATEYQQRVAVKRQPMLKKQPSAIIAPQPKEEEVVKERESAKMLVILQSGEQRLITFTLPKESCTVQELLEQVGVPFSTDSNIQCISNPGADIDYVVTVGVTVDSSELMAVAENTMKQPQVQAQVQAQIQQHQQIQQQLQQQQQQAIPQLHFVPPQKMIAHQATQQPLIQPQLVPEQTPGKIEPKPKFVKGYLAVCNYCGASSMDHARCQRCKREFKGEVKVIRMPNAQSPQRQPITQQIVPGKLTIVKTPPELTKLPTNSALRPSRPRGPRKPAKQEEPIVLTLSSDDEATNDGPSSQNSAVNSSQNTTQNDVAQEIPPLSCEINVNDMNDVPFPAATRENVLSGKTTKEFKCRSIRIGEHRYEPKENVTISEKGIRIVAPSVRAEETNPVVLNIQRREIAKLLYHTSKSLSVVFLYVSPSCSQYVRESLDMGMPEDGTPFFSSASSAKTRNKIVFLVENDDDNFKNMLTGICEGDSWHLEEISYKDANELLVRATYDAVVGGSSNNNYNTRSSKNANGNAVPPANSLEKAILIYPPGKGGMPIYTEDYVCLAIDQYLNDVIIDFYLKYLTNEVLTSEQRSRTHIFSSFFYKRLTTVDKTRGKPADKDQRLNAAQKRHARVRKWTKDVDLFSKDFIVIPINEQSHWFLAIICYPSLNGPVTMDGDRPLKQQLINKIKRVPDASKAKVVQIGSTTITAVKKEELINVPGDESERDEAEGDDSELNSGDDSGEEDTADPETQPIKQPCILIFDSLAGTSRSRVVATLRDYLTCEYRAKSNKNPQHIFNKDTLPGCNVKVPQQNNFTDCGLYLLQYVEQFFQDPIKDYRLPIKGLQIWFESIIATKKREDISKLLIELCSKLNPSVLPALPEIEFPTLDGKLIETEDTGEFEEDMDGETTDELPPPPEERTTPVKITRQIKFAKRSSDDKNPRKTPAKMQRLEEG